MPARLRKAPTKRETGHSKAVTLEDVALAAGVTSMTVSRAIKGHNEIAPATRDRVLRIARELNYTANLSARALATGKTGIIAVISGSLNQYYYANIVHLLESQITKSGYQMRLLHTDSDLHHLVTSTNASAVDGVIVAGQHQLFGKLRQLAPQVFNLCVFIDTSKNPETDYIHSNVGSALDEGLKLMLAAGRQRIAYVGHFDVSVGRDEWMASHRYRDHSPAEARFRTYIGAMERAGLPCELIGTNLLHHTSIHDALQKYIAEFGCPEALVCVNDETAMYVYRALVDLGFKIPDNTFLLGCDGLPFMNCFEPPLSTIAQPTEEICALAWQFLKNRMANPDLPRQEATFDAQLVVRKSMMNLV